MTPRSFWTIVVKIMGIYVTYNLLTTVWQSINVSIAYSSLADTFGRHHTQYGYAAEIEGFILLIIYILTLYSCLFKTEWVIDKLKLDKGYKEEYFEFNIQRATVLKIIVIVIGGLLFANIIPDLIKEVFIYFHRVAGFESFEYTRYIVYIIADLIKTVISLLMITCSNSIVNFIEGKRRDTDGALEE